MKLKNDDPGKILSKSDDWFKSYGQKIFFINSFTWNRNRNREPGNWLFRTGKPGYLGY